MFRESVVFAPARKILNFQKVVGLGGLGGCYKFLLICFYTGGNIFLTLLNLQFERETWVKNRGV